MIYTGIIGGVLILYYIYNKLTRWTPNPPSILNTNKLFIYGHRGVPSHAPENTLYSFQKAFEFNVDGIELDVQITKDNILVIHHDSHLERLTGKQTLISALKYNELLSIDARGPGFSSFEIQRIPKLEDVLDILPEDTAINIEIKSQQLSSEGMEQLVVNAILKYNLLNKAIVSSFNPLRLRKIKSLDSRISTAQLWGSEGTLSTYRWIYISRPDLFHGNIDQLNHNMISNLKTLGLNIYAYTVNSETQLSKVKFLNLDGIFTDDPVICN
jgi:glycerophosphoryl diester phosphodiesterase